jgi:hypothetical protein
LEAADMQTRGRDDLIDDVRYGRMSPEAAEAEAVRLGLPPIANKPDPSTYNPMGKPWWTIIMAIAWIAWRSSQKVTEQWDEYRRDCWCWNFHRWRIGWDGPVHEGHFLEQREPATFLRLGIAGRYDEVHQLVPEGWINIDVARAKLWAALGENLLQATGIGIKGRKRAVIPDHEWRDLDPADEHVGAVLLPRRQGLTAGEGYRDVVVRRQNVMVLWPPSRGEGHTERLPELMKPEGGGYMPLYCAAQWIATEGGKADFQPNDVTVWRPAFAQLLARIASDEVAITGIGGHEREKLAGYLFASCNVDYPFTESSLDFVFGDELYLRSYPYIDEEHWQRRFHDSLQNRTGVRWSKLMVLKSDVARWWPFGIGQSNDRPPAVASRTGAPGRPSSMHLIKREHQTRWDRGEALEGVAAEARELHDWFVATHADEQPPTARTIENQIRDDHRQRKASARK